MNPKIGNAEEALMALFKEAAELQEQSQKQEEQEQRQMVPAIRMFSIALVLNPKAPCVLVEAGDDTQLQVPMNVDIPDFAQAFLNGLKTVMRDPATTEEQKVLGTRALLVIA